MQHADFQIGTEFFTATGKWRCTDVGTRVIVAISLESQTMIRVRRGESGERIEEGFLSDDPRDRNYPEPLSSNCLLHKEIEPSSFFSGRHV